MSHEGTYVFLDLESTDHPRQSIVLTKITELSLVAAKIQDIVDANSGETPPNEKMTKYYNPFRLVQPGVTGLTNELLENEKGFDVDAFNAIEEFLERQQKPVYLIAHNGEVFDFPLLQKYFKKLGVSLSKDILYADSLKYFQEIDKENSKNEVTDWDYAPSRKLSNIYKSYFGLIDDGLTPHEAESDCIMLMKIVVHLRDDFVKWVGNNHGRFADVKPVCSLTRQIFGL